MRDSLNSNPDLLIFVDTGTKKDLHTVLHIQNQNTLDT